MDNPISQLIALFQSLGKGMTLGQPHWQGGAGLPPKERLKAMFPDLNDDAIEFLLQNGAFSDESGPISRPIQR